MENQNSTALTLPDEATFRNEMTIINRFQQVVHSCMIEGHDFGVIPGTQKPTLLKPGAEKIAKLLGLADTYEIVDSREDWDKPFFHYLVRAILTNANNGILVSSGLGECNSMESRYRWRWVGERDLPPGIDKGALVTQERKGSGGGHWTVYRVENEDIYSQVNTILKMAKKRALVDAALSASRLSDVFTQDIEDIPSLAKDNVIEGEIIQPDKSSHYCKVHDTAFFKRGAMKGYAHPIGDTGEWCNEPEEKKAATPPVAKKQAPVEVSDKRGEFEKEGRDILEEELSRKQKPVQKATGQVLHPIDEEAPPELSIEEKAPPAVKSPIDLEWLAENLGILQSKLKGWSNVAVIGKLQVYTGKDAQSVSEAVSYLTADQSARFVAEINDTVAMA